MINSAILVLNRNYEPLNVCNARRAFVLLDRGKAEVLENGRGYLRSPSLVFPIPAVIRLIHVIHRPRAHSRLSRRDVFLRDRYTCQYCGRRTRDLTLDHVLPRHHGGDHDWENVVAACKSCNHRKAGRTPKQAGMRLIRQPTRPSFNPYRPFYHYLEEQVEWRKFIPGWEPDSGFS